MRDEPRPKSHDSAGATLKAFQRCGEVIKPAEGCGTRAKTDLDDARILARMGVALKLEPDAPIAENLLALRDLQVARTALVKERTRLGNRLRNRSHVQLNPILKRQIKARLTPF